MADRTSALWAYRFLFVVIAALVIFVQLLPIRPGPGGIPGPDVLLLLAFSWIIMRPELVPVILVAAVFLAADILFMRPPGLWTLLAVFGTEFLRARAYSLRDAPLFVEWLLVGGVVLAMTLANALILGLFVVNQPPLGLTLIRVIVTILAYPLVMVLGGRAFGLRKMAPGETDRLGQRL